ncbi:MAG TPA: DNA-binding response regulator, partial [Saprospirales bacterium]|nr:DNA-binding response regulator [Saprospirales bacterium]
MENIKILLVDDEEEILDFLSYNLEKSGFVVYRSLSGKEAIELAKVILPDIIVLDVMMPEMDGWEVCRKLRQSSVVPILMLTALGDEVDRILGLELGADDY